MTFALIQDGVVAEYPYSLITFREANPNVSLPYDATEAQLNEQNIYTVYPTNPPTYHPITQNLNEVTPTIQAGLWTQTWAVTPATPQEIEYRTANAKAENANYGKQLLLNTDWTAPSSIADPLESDPYLANRQEFLTYRSAVRAIVLNPPVEAPAWPDLPAEDWQSAPLAQPELSL